MITSQGYERLRPSSLCAVAVGPPLTLSPPVIFFSPSVMSCRFCELMGSLACFCACAVGPPLTGSSLPVSFFSASVMADIVDASNTPELCFAPVAPWYMSIFALTIV